MTTQTVEYINTKQSTLYETGNKKDISGFVHTKEAISKSDQIHVAQHNYLIQYLTHLSENINDLHALVLLLKDQLKAKIEAGLDIQLKLITKKLENLKISPSPLVQKHNTIPFIFQVIPDKVPQ